MTTHHRTRSITAVALALAGASIAGANSGRANSDSSSPVSQSVERGSALYQKHCSVCHGPHGKGDGKEACDLDPPPGDLTTKGVAGMSDSQLYRRITNGRRPMPAFRKLMNDQQRWDVVHFVRTLATAHEGTKR